MPHSFEGPPQLFFQGIPCNEDIWKTLAGACAGSRACEVRTTFRKTSPLGIPNALKGFTMFYLIIVVFGWIMLKCTVLCIYIYIQKPIPNSAIGGQRLLRKIAGGAEDDPALLRRHSLQQREIETSLDQVPRASIQMAVRWIVIGPWIVVVWTW